MIKTQTFYYLPNSWIIAYSLANANDSSTLFFLNAHPRCSLRGSFWRLSSKSKCCLGSIFKLLLLRCCNVSTVNVIMNVPATGGLWKICVCCVLTGSATYQDYMKVSAGVWTQQGCCLHLLHVLEGNDHVFSCYSHCYSVILTVDTEQFSKWHTVMFLTLYQFCCRLYVVVLVTPMWINVILLQQISLWINAKHLKVYHGCFYSFYLCIFHISIISIV